METWSDVWQYLCQRPCYELLQFYVTNPNDVAKAFWNGVLTVLELEGRITMEQGLNIWKEITKGLTVK